MDRKKLGEFGENIASKHLLDLGFNILDRNFSTRFGEIDIIAEIDDFLVFCEVKTRRNLEFGYAFESVDIKKQKKIIKTSIKFLQDKDFADKQIRYDIIEIYVNGNIYSINHIENAFLT